MGNANTTCPVADVVPASNTSSAISGDHFFFIMPGVCSMPRLVLEVYGPLYALATACMVLPLLQASMTSKGSARFLGRATIVVALLTVGMGVALPFSYDSLVNQAILEVLFGINASLLCVAGYAALCAATRPLYHAALVPWEPVRRKYLAVFSGFALSGLPPILAAAFINSPALHNQLMAVAVAMTGLGNCVLPLWIAHGLGRLAVMIAEVRTNAPTVGATATTNGAASGRSVPNSLGDFGKRSSNMQMYMTAHAMIVPCGSCLVLVLQFTNSVPGHWIIILLVLPRSPSSSCPCSSSSERSDWGGACHGTG